MSPGQKRRKAAEAAAEKGIPLGLVRVATLDRVRALLTYTGYTYHLFSVAVQSTALPALTYWHHPDSSHHPPWNLTAPTATPHPSAPAVGEADALR